MASSALVGTQIAPTERLATLPLALSFVGVLTMLIPASLLMQRYGRRVGFALGGCSGVIAGGLAGYGIYSSSFILFCVASFLFGIASSFAQFYRFAATEVATEHYKSRAISWVLAGGLIAAFIGPTIARYTKDSLIGPSFSASYVCISLLSLGVIVIQLFLRIPKPALDMTAQPKRPLFQVFGQLTFIVAATCAMIAYGTMNLLMTATPLGMDHHGMDFAAIATVIQWHIVGMFAPSFFTGHLIHRFGVLSVMFAGAIMLVICGLISMSGGGFWYFLPALVLLGIGWNFLYIGGTTLLTEVYRPSEKGLVQGVNDFLVFSAVVATAFGSGYLHFMLGWEKLNQNTIPVVMAAAVMTACLYFYRKRSTR